MTYADIPSTHLRAGHRDTHLQPQHEGWGQEDPWKSLASLPSQLMSSRFSEKLCLKKIRRAVKEEI